VVTFLNAILIFFVKEIKPFGSLPQVVFGGQNFDCSGQTRAISSEPQVLFEEKDVLMFSRLALRTTRSVPRTSSAFRSFHVSPPSNNDQGESAVAEEEDDNIGNDGVLGNLFGNPYTSIPLCGLGVMTATATDVSPYIFTPMFRIVLCATGKWCNCVKQWELRTQKKEESF
jgi:hypothetical protein